MTRRRPLALFFAALALAAAACAESPPAARAEVDFNFEQVELRALVRLVGEMTGRRFVVDDSMQGRVTVVTPGRIPADEAYPLLVAVLESAGFSVSEANDVSRIVRLPQRAVDGGMVRTGAEDAQGLVTKVIPVSNVSVAELRRLLEPMVRGGKEGAIAAFPPSNHLIITDTANAIRELERIIAELDRPGAAKTLEIVPLKHASAEEVARDISLAMKGAETPGDRVVARHLQQVAEGSGNVPADLVIVPSIRANSLLMVGTSVQMRQMREIIEKIDVEPSAAHGRLRSIFLQYLSAEEASKSLNALLAKTTEKDKRNPISVEFNAANNALLVDASPADFEYLQGLVRELDRVPQQVLVEVMIAEVAVGKGIELGVELATVDTAAGSDDAVFVGRSRPGQSDTLIDFISQGISPQGIALGVAKGSITTPEGDILPNLPFLVRALAEDRDVKILSNPILWAQNNTEASVNVVENIPILRSTIEGGSGTARDVIQNVDRIDVGIKLKVTPYITPQREVTLRLNPSIEAIIDQGPPETQFAPTISKREVSTTVTVTNEATVVISGLMREDRVKTVSKIPFLGDIPLLGFLFRSTSERMQKTNLLIFVTPHIVTDRTHAEALQKRLQEQSGIPGPAPVPDVAPEVEPDHASG